MKIQNDIIQSDSLIGSTYSMLVADEFGIISTQSIPTSGGSQDLSQTLAIGNDSGTYSIIIGTNSYISNPEGGRIDFYTNGIILSNDNGVFSDSFVDISNMYAEIYSIDVTNIGALNTISLNTSWEGGIYISNYTGAIWTGIKENILIFNNSTASISSQSTQNYNGVMINSRNSTMDAGIINSVIIGGGSINATMSDTVYVSNLNVGGKNISSGTVSMVSGEATISTDLIDINSIIFLTYQEPTTFGSALQVTGKTPGVTFSIYDGAGTTNGIVGWFII